MKRRPWIPAILLLGSFPALPQTGYMGAKACAGCHPKQSASHAGTGHARSLHPAAAHPAIASMLPADSLVRPPSYRFRFRREDQQVRVQAHDGNDVMDIPVDWAFGAGDQAVTFVSRINEDWYLEHFFTFYKALGRMAPTAGHGELRPKTLPEAMGVPYKTSDPRAGILGCFECHSTGPVSTDAQRGLQPLELGVQCESCHGAGRDHMAAASRGATAEARKRIGNPKRLSPIALNEFCGRCHRPPASEGAIDWNYSWNVRHQPVYLSQSQCLQKSEGRLSCFTCHEAHQPLAKTAASYNERCASCHTAQGCRVLPERSNCIDCHMPRVSPQPGLRFSNHWIGVYGAGSKLKPNQAP
jgi:hypothetical protein